MLNMKKLFIETYGCQMNVADSEVVATIMQMAGYEICEELEHADAVFLNTCSVRDNAEQKIYSRLQYFTSLRRQGRKLIVGVLGCMAERVREELAKHGVNLVAGPDSYLDLPNLIAAVEQGETAINVKLSTTETYKEIIPTRIGHSRISGFISIMRGCNNFCSYCIVPYTRGRERSREPESILAELRDLEAKGFKEVTLLGQNVNSYLYHKKDADACTNDLSLSDTPQTADPAQANNNNTITPAGREIKTTDNGRIALNANAATTGKDVCTPICAEASDNDNITNDNTGKSTGTQPMKTASVHADDTTVDFADLLAMVAEAAPGMRIRFSTSNPEDMSDKILETMAAHSNICRHLHLPVQSGSSRILKLMNRKYDRAWYLNRIAAVKRILPDCGLSTDVFCGFCTETEEDQADTLSLMREVGFDTAFMFKYSERPGTFAARHYKDDVPEEVKIARLTEIINLQNELSLSSNRRDIGKTFEVLVEGYSKRSREQMCGRSSQNKMIVFPKGNIRPGDTVNVKVTDVSSATLIGELV